MLQIFWILGYKIYQIPNFFETQFSSHNTYQVVWVTWKKNVKPPNRTRGNLLSFCRSHLAETCTSSLQDDVSTCTRIVGYSVSVLRVSRQSCDHLLGRTCFGLSAVHTAASRGNVVEADVAVRRKSADAASVAFKKKNNRRWLIERGINATTYVFLSFVLFFF